MNEFIEAMEAAIEHKLIQTWVARYGFDLEIGVSIFSNFPEEIREEMQKKFTAEFYELVDATAKKGGK